MSIGEQRGEEMPLGIEVTQRGEHVLIKINLLQAKLSRSSVLIWCIVCFGFVLFGAFFITAGMLAPAASVPLTIGIIAETMAAVLIIQFLWGFAPEELEVSSSGIIFQKSLLALRYRQTIERGWIKSVSCGHLGDESVLTLNIIWQPPSASKPKRLIVGYYLCRENQERLLYALNGILQSKG